MSQLHLTLAADAMMGLAQLLAMTDQDDDVPVRGMTALVRLVADAAAPPLPVDGPDATT